MDWSFVEHNQYAVADVYQKKKIGSNESTIDSQLAFHFAVVRKFIVNSIKTDLVALAYDLKLI